MSEPKFTKGPWNILHDSSFDECIIYAEREEDRVVICEVGTCVTVSDKDHSIDLKQIKANTKLLADAWQLPDLRNEITKLKKINSELYDALYNFCMKFADNNGRLYFSDFEKVLDLLLKISDETKEYE